MAERGDAIARRAGLAAWAGSAAAGLVLALVLGTLAAVFWRAESAAQLGPADWAALRFTVMQAALSAGLSVALAVPVARALARRRFVGRRFLVALMGAPFILPVIVAVLGLLVVFGRNGWISDALALAGWPRLNIYGLRGVVLAHVFFNLPLAVRLLLQGWQGVPAERFQLAASLGFGAWAMWRHVEAPLLRRVLPGALVVIFLVCVTSFAVVLALGGGPRATTVELAIYQAVRFDFDLGKAAVLALMQVALAGAAALALLAVHVPAPAAGGLDRVVARFDGRGALARALDAAWIALAAALLLLPLAPVVARGAAGLAGLPGVVWLAAGRSLLVAGGSVAVALGLALPMAFGVQALAGRRLWRGLVEGAGYLVISASPLVMGLGLFILVYPWADPSGLALPLTAVVNAAMALPFMLRVLIPAVAEIEAQYGRLADSLGLVGWQRLRLLHLVRLRRPLGFAAGLAAALSMGDLGVIALFSDGERATLPLQLYRLMAAYRMDQAAAAALLLLGLALALFWLFARGGRVDADA